MMKYFHTIFLLSIICLTVGVNSHQLFALPSDCNSNATDIKYFLKECARGTVSIDPSKYSSDKTGVKERVQSIAQVAISLGALFAVAFLVWAGIQYTTAYGDDEKIKHAKSTGIYAAIGLILMMASFGLIDILLNFIYKVGGA